MDERLHGKTSHTLELRGARRTFRKSIPKGFSCPFFRLVDKVRMMAKMCLPEVGKCLPEVKMCLPEVEMMFAGSGDVFAGSGDVFAGSGNVVAMNRKLRVFWKTKIQACGGPFCLTFLKKRLTQNGGIWG